MLWVITIFLLIITIMLLCGKGSFLIAGYNTASKDDKLNYDEKKLCRVVGIGMGVTTACLAFSALLGNYSSNKLLFALPIVIIFVVNIITLILCNTICKSKNVALKEESSDKVKRDKRIFAVSLIFIAVVFLLIGIYLVTGEIKTTVDEKNINIVCSYWQDYIVELDSISSISYVENLELGKRTNGFGSFKLLAGRFRNNEFGDYILYAYLKCDNFIVLDTSHGIVALNAQTQEETQALYELLKKLILTTVSPSDIFISTRYKYIA